MNQSEFLRVGDVIEITLGMTVVASVPTRYVFSNRRDSNQFTTHGVTVGTPLSHPSDPQYETSYLIGDFIVVEVEANGHRVLARQLGTDGVYDEDGIPVSFYQSGAFSSKILPGDIAVKRRMRMTFVPI